MEQTCHAITFDVGVIHAVVYPAHDGAFARFLLFRALPEHAKPILVASGTEEKFADCLARARRAAHALELVA